ncbi:LytR family transcriptional attenuator [Nocardia neocaledoniensis]|uniref:LytR family transcriptional attenuator n=2 Tax=Nocardia neocaledoniensis TaxID=236511 RepID=A0A317NN14_9NOCA|nr:LCP family protein [Nocardia neocaledoniensis]PWV76397.1 LytR family transcriptional attenuator [Nocardia neocaledoniensis]
MNGDDPRRRRVPPTGRPGGPPLPPPQGRPRPGGRPVPPGNDPTVRHGGPHDPTVRHNPAPGRPASHIEPTQVLHRDGRDQPLAYSQMPPEQPKPRPHAPTQRPVPYREPVRHAPTQRPVPHHDRVPPRRTPPPVDAGRQERPPRRRRRRHPFRWFTLIVVLLIVGLIAAIVHLDNSLTRIPALTSYSDRIGDTPGTNWLLVGSDGRGDLSTEQEAELATGGDTGPERTDTIMLVHIPESGPTTMVSLPRDSYVSVPGHGKDKLNASFALGGAPLLVQTVEVATGVRIDHYAQIGFGGFAGVVDALDGIEMCLDEPIVDPLAGLDLPAGCQKLSGPQALGFVRTRATPNADVDRMNHQRMFMSALLKKATSAGTLANPFALWPMATGVAGSLKVDDGDHIWNLAALGWAMRGDTVTTSVPIGGFDDTDVGNVLLWDKSKAPGFFDALAKDQQIPEDLLTR